jgi:hypothetical protein
MMKIKLMKMVFIFIKKENKSDEMKEIINQLYEKEEIIINQLYEKEEIIINKYYEKETIISVRIIIKKKE